MLIDLLIRALAPILAKIFAELLGMQARGEIHEVDEEVIVHALKNRRDEVKHAVGFLRKNDG